MRMIWVNMAAWCVALGLCFKHPITWGFGICMGLVTLWVGKGERHE